MTELPIVFGCAAFGAAIGAAVTPVARWLLTGQDHHWLISTAALATATALLFGLLAWRFGLHTDLAAYGCLAVVAGPLIAIDLIDHRLPWSLLLVLYVALAGLFGLAALLAHDSVPLMRALLGMVASFALYLLVALLSHGGLGAGDVRLAGALGLALAWRGWMTLVSGTVLGLFYAAFVSVTLVSLRRATRHTQIPFGPALIAGTFTAVMVPLG